MTYTSPFRLVDDDHDSEDPLCLSLEHYADPVESTWNEFYEAALLLIDSGLDQPAFFAARHFVELSLKRIAPSHHHKLKRLLDVLPADDPLNSADEATADLREFILDLARVDPTSTAGRYATAQDGIASFTGVCCVDRSEVLLMLTALHDHVSGRMAAADVPA